MRSTLTLLFGTTELSVDLPASEPAWPADEARRWLDQQFLAHDCEPLRAAGKVLTADKLLAIAAAIGAQGFEHDAALRLDFARAALGALARPLVRIDVDAASVTF